MGSRLKVLHVITGLGAGGAQRGLVELIRHLPDVEHHVVTLKDEAPHGEKIRALGTPVTNLELHVARRAAAGSYALWRLARRVSPDWIHTWLYHADLLGGTVGRTLGIPVLWHLHVSDLDPRGVKTSTAWVARRCAQLSKRLPHTIVACSRATADAHHRMGYAPMTVVDNGVDTERFRPRSSRLRAELGCQPDDFLIGLVARFDPQKDVRTFLRAAATLRRTHPRARFVLVGRGMSADNETLAAWIGAHDLAPAIHLLGPRDDLSALYSTLSVFSLSSVSEASSMSLLEAMACATIPVVTDAGDSRRVIAEAGLVVPTRDPEALASAWARVASMSGEERLRLGEAARERVRTSFSARLQAERFRALYATCA